MHAGPSKCKQVQHFHQYVLSSNFVGYPIVDYVEKFMFMKNVHRSEYLNNINCGIFFFREGQCIVGSQNLPGSQGRNFVRSKFRIVLTNI